MSSVELAASILMYFGQDFDSLDGLRTNLQWQDGDSDPDVCLLAAGNAGAEQRKVLLAYAAKNVPKGSKRYAVVVHYSHSSFMFIIP